MSSRNYPRSIYVPHERRHGGSRNKTRIIGGDGSKWLADIQKDEDMNGHPNHPIKRDDWQGSRARQDEALRRMAHQPWAAPEPEPMSWPFAVFIAFIIIVVIAGQFGDFSALLGAS